jgi:hypothetical protein
MGSLTSVRFAAESRLEGEAQRRVCEIRKVVIRGWPTVAITESRDEEGELKDSDAVCRMWV